MSLNRPERDQAQLPLVGLPPHSSPPVSACLRALPAMQWVHKDTYADTLVVAVMCGCANCEKVILSTFRRRR